MFDLVATSSKAYLHHKSGIGEFTMASDSVIPTFTRSTRISHIVRQIPLAEREQFDRLGYTIGGMMIFPGKKVDGRMTINGARGCDYRIKDRFDLTVECIRRHYVNDRSPLAEALARYGVFFQLFGHFRAYVDFFLLQDIVSADYSSVKFFLPFDEFQPWPLPTSVLEYISYREHAEAFIRARNERILVDSRSSATSCSTLLQLGASRCDV